MLVQKGWPEKLLLDDKASCNHALSLSLAMAFILRMVVGDKQWEKNF